jgi:hypothetical protein
MIGGHDRQFRTNNVGAAMEGAIRLALAIWKNAVVESAETGERLDHRIVEIRELPREVLVYRDVDAHRAWAQDGAIPPRWLAANGG